MDNINKKETVAFQNEGLFGNIANKLGMGGQKNSVAKALGGGRYAIGNNVVMSLNGVTEDVFLNYDWDNGKLSFLKNSNWMANVLGLQISHGVEAVTAFDGKWNAGSFIGNFFGDFHGDSFEGNFQSAYASYGSDPSTFVNGRITSFQRGVLGLAKVDVMSLDSGSQKKYVSLLELQVGHFCNLTDENGVTHSFQVTKSCDNKSMDIEIQEETGQKRAIRIPWSEMRKGNDPNEFRRLSSIRIGGRPQIPYLFVNDRVGKITNIEVSTKGTMFGTTVDTYQMDMTLVRPLAYPAKFATIHLFTPEEVVRFGKIYHELGSNAMQLHLRNVMDGIRFGIITGWSGYPHLAPIFGNVEGTKVTHSKYAASLAWLEEFIEIVVLRIMKSRTIGKLYMSNEYGRKIIFSKLAAMLASAKPAAPTPAPAPSSSTTPSSTAPLKARPSAIPEAYRTIDRIFDGVLKQKAR